MLRKAIAFSLRFAWKKKKREEEENNIHKRFYCLVATNMVTLTLMLADTLVSDAVTFARRISTALGNPFAVLGTYRSVRAMHLSGTTICGFPSPGISIYYRLTQYLFTSWEILAFCCVSSYVQWREKKKVTIFPERWLLFLKKKSMKEVMIMDLF